MDSYKLDPNDPRNSRYFTDLQKQAQQSAYVPHQMNPPTLEEALLKDAERKARPPVLFRTFESGATRDTDENKLDFEGFLSPAVLEAFAKYMHEKRKMPDGSLRDSDNWQKGIPVDQYMKSMFRHFFAVWKRHRNGGSSHQLVEELLALFFNVQGMTHELLKQGSYEPSR